MRKLFLKTLLCLLLLGACDSCLEEAGVPLCISNESTQDVCVLLGKAITDTLLPDIDSSNLLFEIPKGMKEDIGGGGGMSSWKEAFEYFGIDTMRVFILATDTVEMYDWDIIQKNYNILKRYDVSYEDLNNLNRILYYPPIPVMRDIGMWPPYGE